MGVLVNFCAGAHLESLPGKEVSAILVNAAQGGPPSVLPATIELLELSGATSKACDSGGYQVLEAELKEKEISFDKKRPLECSANRINITPWHVVDVFREMSRKVRLDMGVALDFPIKTLSGPEEREKEFMSKLGYNVRWAIQTAELRKKLCPQVPLFIPVQCFDLEQFDLFLSCISGIDFDGWSMPLRSHGLREVASFLARFYQSGIRRVHLLGAASFKVIALAAYMARHFFDSVSLDATSWRKNAEVSLFSNPHDLSCETLRGDVQIDESVRNDCPCPFCRGRSFTYLKNMPYTERTHFLRCHNFWVTDNACKELYRNCENIAALERFLTTKSSNPHVVTEIIDSVTWFHLLVDSDTESLKGGNARMI
jgi:tRNA-guanine family transglycosylase